MIGGFVSIIFEMEWEFCVVFKDTTPHQGRSVSFMTIHACKALTKSDIRPHVKWTVSLVIANGQFYLSQGFVWVYNLIMG